MDNSWEHMMVMFVDNRRVKQQNRLQITFIKDDKNVEAL